MKKSIFVALFAFATLTMFATVRTVSNSPFGGAEYSTLQAAYDASVNGDVLHVEGTNVPYSINTHWQKSLTVIGIGFNADKQNSGKTYFNTANPTAGFFVLGAGSSGSQFYGINFQVPVYVYGNIGASNLLLADCSFASVFNLVNQSTNGITIRNSIFLTIYSAIDIGGNTSVVSGISISNCVFNGHIYGRNNVNVSMNVDHCLFLGIGTAPFVQVVGANISNNIFMNAFPPASYTAECNYYNNISRLPGTFPPAGSGNIASNNIEATDPDLVGYTLGAVYSATHDYNLQAGSAAIGAGSDATDIGVHGGNSMFFSEQGEVLINPIIRELSILNPTVTPNGTLEVKIIATKPKDN